MAPKTRYVRLGLYNAGSLNTGHDDFLVAVNRFDPDILAINETWIAAGEEACAPAPPGYRLRCTPRPRHMRGGRGGGVAFYYKQTLSVRFLKYPKANIEQMWLTTQNSGRRILVGTAYRPQWVSLDVFIDAITDSITSFGACDYVVLLGDFNVNLLNSQGTDTIKMLQFIRSLDLNQVVTGPTHFSFGTETLIDLVCTDCSVTDISVSNITGSLGHAMVNVSIKISKTKIPPKVVTYRPIRSIDIGRFNEHLEAIDWESIYELDSVDAMVDTFNHCVTTLFDTHAPLKTVKIRESKSLPWVTDNVKLMIDLRNEAHTRSRRTGTERDRHQYKELRELVARSIFWEKRAYYNQLVNSQLGDSKKLWKNIKSKVIVNPTKSDSLPESFSDPNLINAHFLRVPGSDVVQISDLTYYEYHRHSDAVFKLSPVSETEIAKYIRSMTSNAVGGDGITRDMLILTLPRTLAVITAIINRSISTGRVPRQWKHSLVTPIPKVDDPSDLKDLRPISILPYMSKILEKSIYSQLYGFVERNNILPSMQSGFRRGRGTVTALLDVTDNVLAEQDSGCGTVLTLLDFSRAFDCLNTSLLISKLAFYGIDRQSISWFDSYLTQRSQSVRLVGADGGVRISNACLVDRGVPQGSILGPLLFIIYSADLSKAIKHSRFHCYADDVQLYISAPPNDMKAALCKMGEDLDRIANWSDRNCLVLNAEKSKYLILGSKSQVQKIVSANPRVEIQGQHIASVHEARNLGLLFDSHLHFEGHLMRLVKSCFYRLRVLYKIRNLLSEDARIRLCETLILSILNYGDLVYGPRMLSGAQRLIQRVQNACCRFCFHVPPRSHITPFLDKASMLNMRSRRQLHLASLMFDVVNFARPDYLHRKLRFPTDFDSRYGTRAARPPLSTHMHRTAAFEGSFRHQATKCWNNVPPPLRDITVKKKFKQMYKLHLLQLQSAGVVIK